MGFTFNSKLFGGIGTGGGGSGTPGGLDTHVQFNDGGAFGGQNTFTYTKAVGALTLTPAADATVLTARAFTAGTVPIAQFQNATGGNQITIGPAGDVATGAGVALGLTATAPAATTGASQAGVDVTITASPAVASTDTAGAAAGGDVNYVAGAAARNASGNANGGNHVFTGGAGIGTGVTGGIVLGALGTGKLWGFANGIGIGTAANVRAYIGGTNSFYGITTGSDGTIGVSGAPGTGEAGLNTPDTFFRRRAAANPAWGVASATPVAYQHNLAADARAGTDTNVAGANAIIAPGVGTGDATGSTLTVQTPAAGASGTTAQTLTTRLVAGPTGINIPNLAEYADNAAAVTGGLVTGDLYRTSTGVLMVVLP